MKTRLIAHLFRLIVHCRQLFISCNTEDSDFLLSHLHSSVLSSTPLFFFRKFLGEAIDANLTFKFLTEQLVFQEIVENVQDNLLQEFGAFLSHFEAVKAM